MRRPTRSLRAFVSAVALALLGAAPARADLHERIAALLAEHAREPIARLELPANAALAAAARAPGVELELSLATPPTRPGSNAVTVRLARGGAPLQRAVITVRVWMQRELVVATRALRAGETLADGDLAFASREVAAPLGDVVARIEPALGKRVRRHVDAGEPLLAAWLEAAPRVRRGERVTLRLARGPLTIEAVGLAEQDGAVGEWVRVRNTDSRRALSGRVAADGVVHVGR